LVPTSTGISADQLSAPEAVPELPVDVDQRTAVTPTSSAAVPLTMMETESVETILEAGDMIRSVGRVVSVPEGGWAGGFEGGLGDGGAGAGVGAGAGGAGGELGGSEPSRLQ